jgi:pimeloyl-ACP methyl ester carboxylesterase
MNLVLLVIINLVIVLLSGFVYEMYATRRDRKRYQHPPGKRIDLGTHHLHVYELGEHVAGKPTVVFDHGIGGNSLDWQFVQPEVSQYARAVSYDRAGYGWSTQGPKPRTSERIVDELRAALQQAGIEPPYVLVGHSFGGIHARLYAARYPQEVAGIVLVDSSHPEMIAERNTKPELRRLRTVSNLKRFGIVRLMFPRLLERANRLPPDERRRYIAFHILDSDTILFEAEPLFEHGIQLPEVLPDELALTVVSRAEDEDLSSESLWGQYQRKLAALSVHARHIHAATSNHFIAMIEPETVIRAIRDILYEIETKQRKDNH